MIGMNNGNGQESKIEEKKEKPVRHITEGTQNLYYILLMISMAVSLAAIFMNTNITSAVLSLLMLPAGIFGLRVFMNEYYTPHDQLECYYCNKSDFKRRR
jgi:hypothetical protein